MRRLERLKVEMLATPDQQISLTDPDARSMATSGRGSGVVGYNVQIAVEANHHLIVMHEVFKCAVKDDETLIDAIVERLYGEMKEFDGRRADRIVGLIVDRDATGGATLRVFLDEVLLDPSVRAGA
jgi:hypothetical protein